MVRFCLKPTCRSHFKFLLILLSFQSIAIFSVILLRKNIWNKTENKLYIEYRLIEGKTQIFHQHYRKFPGDLQFPVLQDLITINSSRIGIHPENIGAKYPNSVTDFERLLRYHFQPILTGEERKLILFTFQTFVNLCQRHKLTYFLAYGSLLGSYRHHGMVPWDDDIDVFMNETEKKDAILIFENVPGFELSHRANYQWKFYPKFYRTLLFFQHRWPFIDIFFFAENETHVWDNTSPQSGTYPGQPYSKEEVFPLGTRPFEGLLLKVPCDVITIMAKTVSSYKWCESNYYWHKLERFAVSWRPKRIMCSRLYTLYPFVFRNSITNGSKVVENLKINGKIIKTYEFKNQCKKEKTYVY